MTSEELKRHMEALFAPYYPEWNPVVPVDQEDLHHGNMRLVNGIPKRNEKQAALVGLGVLEEIRERLMITDHQTETQNGGAVHLLVEFIYDRLSGEGVDTLAWLLETPLCIHDPHDDLRTKILEYLAEYGNRGHAVAIRRFEAAIIQSDPWTKLPRKDQFTAKVTRPHLLRAEMRTLIAETIAYCESR